MPALIPAIAGVLVVAGIIGVIVGSRPTPAASAAPRRHRRLLERVDRRTRILALVGLGVGVVAYVATGWVLTLVLAPAAVVGLPVLLSVPQAATQIDKLEALEEWTRSLSGVLTVGVGLEEAIRASLRSAPDAIRPEVTTLVARLRARTGTEAALRAFADDVDDATGDTVAAFLILGARRRGQGLASVLTSLAESVAADVRARRAIEADRAKSRTTARAVTVITTGALAVLTFTGEYIAPYGTPVGQVVLGSLLAVYVGLLVWMRRMARGTVMPRFLGRSREEVR